MSDEDEDDLTPEQLAELDKRYEFVGRWLKEQADMAKQQFTKKPKRARRWILAP